MTKRRPIVELRLGRFFIWSFRAVFSYGHFAQLLMEKQDTFNSTTGLSFYSGRKVSHKNQCFVFVFFFLEKINVSLWRKVFRPYTIKQKIGEFVNRFAVPKEIYSDRISGSELGVNYRPNIHGHVSPVRESPVTCRTRYSDFHFQSGNASRTLPL